MTQDTEQHIPQVTFDTSAVEFVVEAFGWEMHESGYIVDQGDAVLSPRGETVRADHCAGIVMHEGEPRPIADDFNDLVDFVIQNGSDDETN